MKGDQWICEIEVSPAKQKIQTSLSWFKIAKIVSKPWLRWFLAALTDLPAGIPAEKCPKTIKKKKKTHHINQLDHVRKLANHLQLV